MFQMDTSRHWEVDSNLVSLFIVIVAFVAIYFLSVQLQNGLARFHQVFQKKVGIYANTKEFELQRYVYQHSDSLIAKLYRWVNIQLVSLGLKRLGVTVVGYLIFWGFVALVIDAITTYLLKLGLLFMPALFFVVFVIVLVMTRVMVAERIEMREADIMNAVDLIIPEIHNGVKNAIVMYLDNFAPSVHDDFQAFVTNIQDRGYSFEDAMYILSDNLGLVFVDFAQKAIYYESSGEKDMLEIFNDIVETNRMRRQLREENSNAFAALKASFIVSALMTFGYFIFLMFTDDFSRHFFLQETAGKILLIIMLGVVFGVLAYITTIKSKTI